MIFKPTKPETGKIEDLLPPAAYEKFDLSNIKEIQLKTNDDINLTGWYKPAQEGKPTFLYLPGNTGHFGDCGAGLDSDGNVIEAGREYRLALIEELSKDGFGLLALCYRGFGTSEGKPSEKGLVEDTKTAWNFLRDNGINPNDIIIYGDSLGGGVAFSFAKILEESDQPAVIITTGTFASIAHKAHELYPDIPLENFIPYLNHPFNSVENIRTLTNSQIILMHGTEDKTTYPYHGKILENSAREAGVNVEHVPVKGAGHIDIAPTEIAIAALKAYKRTKAISTPPEINEKGNSRE
jgi:fermentation-respiration switch protein FrsA (DUF1100 family)